MSKLKLNLDDIKVESFETDGINKMLSTVKGEADSDPAICIDTTPSCIDTVNGGSCPHHDSCAGYPRDSCNDTCYAFYTCAGTTCIPTCGDECSSVSCWETCVGYNTCT